MISMEEEVVVVSFPKTLRSLMGPLLQDPLLPKEPTSFKISFLTSRYPARVLSTAQAIVRYKPLLPTYVRVAIHPVKQHQF
jgi:hypothetical protein